MFSEIKRHPMTAAAAATTIYKQNSKLSELLRLDNKGEKNLLLCTDGAVGH